MILENKDLKNKITAVTNFYAVKNFDKVTKKNKDIK